MGCARTLARIGCVALVLVAIVSVRPAGYVGACSCAATSPSLADQVGAAEIAFVGRLDASTALSPSEEIDDWLNQRYELVVEQAVKGVEVGDRIVMFGSSDETSCGTSLLDESIDLHAVVSSSFGGPFIADSTPPCSRAPSVEEMMSFDPRPSPTSGGQLSVVVTGRVGEAELVGYDASGHVLVYGNIDGAAGPVRACPGGERLVLLEQSATSPDVDLVVRDAATLQVVNRVALDVPAELTDFYFFVRGAEVTCRSDAGDEVTIVLPWENTSDGTTLTVDVGPAPNDVAVNAYGRAGRATFDPSVGAVVAVVAVADGALVRLDPSGAEAVIAALTDPVTEPGYGALFLKPAPDGGWWVGLGDGDDVLPTRLKVLARVGADGSVEWWPVVETDGVYAYDATIDFVDGALAAPYFRIPLPAPGTSTSGTAVLPEVIPGEPFSLRLADGRAVRPYPDETGVVELVGLDGLVVPLEHLGEVQSATAIVDGPMIEPGLAPPDFAVELVVSKWIARAGAAVTTDAATTTSAPVANVSAGVTEPTGAPARPGNEGGNSTTAVLLVAVAAVACVGFAVLWTRRRRDAQIEVA
jgi:hypothetical protein